MLIIIYFIITANINFTEDDLERLLEEGNPFQVFTENVMQTIILYFHIIKLLF